MQVIPPLQGLELDFKCKACSSTLFQASSILRHLPGKSPIISRDLSWMYPSAPSDDEEEDDAEFNEEEQVEDADTPSSTDASAAPSSTTLSMPTLTSSFPVASFGDFSSPRKDVMAQEPKVAPSSLGKLGPKSKSFAVRSHASGTSSFDPFDFGSGVPPTPSNRLGCVRCGCGVVCRVCACTLFLFRSQNCALHACFLFLAVGARLPLSCL